MQERHKDRKRYFEEQAITTSKYVIPYIDRFKKVTNQTRVLEIGCGEGGNLKAFLDLGCEAVGVDINAVQLERARDFLKQYDYEPLLLASDIYEVGAELIGRFDVICMRDVIEHIPNQEKFMGHLRQFLKPDGVVFFGFPPWQMPFGGHQQGMKNKTLSKLPYFHLLPRSLYEYVMRRGGLSDAAVQNYMDIAATGITIERFEYCARSNGFSILDRTLYLINPNYEIKFNLQPRVQFPLLRNIPYLRNFYSTCAYYIISLS